ncbi:glucuronate isomerase [Chryseosolibacter indicus]|uniref:Uronate isomerase n=1 Tax=Chryseosolibacter indicus TaxID=2782351 RepID=A0ABS5VRH9_9BACT|nr:glucuronate isomerase [Chryseosolibacter indicus]MBT1704028.1 glucuronate isomerase [Chryseosolibacter indicus]
MAKYFLTEDFLLQNEFSKKLYHQYAKDLPIIDYHCHLPPQDIATNRQFSNLTKIWLEGDHYKWRAMRTLGIDEKYITGNASDEDKFNKWAETVPYTMRNPLYHWTHLELKQYFGVETHLTPDTATEVYNKCTTLLNKPEYATQSLLKKMKVEVIGTTDDPADSLEYHQQIKKANIGIIVAPTFRPDKAYAIENAPAYIQYLEKLGNASGVTIKSFDTLLDALKNRVDFFESNGCKLSDHGLEQLYFPEEKSAFTPDGILKKILKQENLSIAEIQYFKYAVLIELGRMYHSKGWTQQFHLGALRNTNERMLRILGPDTGFDSIGDFQQSRALAKFLNELDKSDQLAKTILYNLNPADNEVMGTMIGNFNDGSTKGKIQFGSAWWFLDQKDGMEKQINALSNLGLLSCFVGMLTDSRSFLSYPRHEYFRRILCNIIGKDVENGELPWDESWLGKLISDICYYNAKNYFEFYK